MKPEQSKTKSVSNLFSDFNLKPTILLSFESTEITSSSISLIFLCKPTVCKYLANKFASKCSASEPHCLSLDFIYFTLHFSDIVGVKFKLSKFLWFEILFNA